MAPAETTQGNPSSAGAAPARQEVKSIFAEGREAAKRKFWNAKPFPHYYIDDFLPPDRFEKLIATVRDLGKPDFSFKTDLEKNKTTFASDSLSAECSALVASLTNDRFLGELTELTGIPQIIPLTAYKDSVYRFYHKMDAGGFLGSHVDHSDVVGDDRVHFLNCIFYGPEKWDPAWGGDTALFGKWGFNQVAKVPCKPNRLLVFLHTSQSFHGVTPLAGNTTHRFTVYMDYYAALKDLPRLNEQARAAGSSFVSKFWKHKTTFVPLTLRHSYKYVRGYARYLRKKPY